MGWDGLGNIYLWGWGGASLKDAYFWTRREKISSFGTDGFTKDVR